MAALHTGGGRAGMPDETKAIVLEGYKNGYSGNWLSKRYNVSERTVRRWAHSAGIWKNAFYEDDDTFEPNKTSKSRLKISQDVINGALNAFRNGEVSSSIVNRLGISKRTFNKWKSDAGLQRDDTSFAEVIVEPGAKYVNKVRCKIDGDKLYLEVLSYDQDYPGKHTITVNFRSEFGADISHDDFVKMIGDAANYLMKSLKAPMIAGEPTLAFVDLPQSYAEKYGVDTSSKAYLIKTEGGIDYAHLTCKKADGDIHTAYTTLRESDADLSLRVLAAMLVANTMTPVAINPSAKMSRH